MGLLPPPETARVGDEHPPRPCEVVSIGSPNLTAFPPDAIEIELIDQSYEEGHATACPPNIIILVAFPDPDPPQLAVARSPKSCALPRVAMVTNSIIL